MKKALSVSQDKQAGSSRARSIMAEGDFLAVAPQPPHAVCTGASGQNHKPGAFQRSVCN